MAHLSVGVSAVRQELNAAAAEECSGRGGAGVNIGNASGTALVHGPGGIRHGGGVTSMQALVRNAGTCRPCATRCPAFGHRLATCVNNVAPYRRRASSAERQRARRFDFFRILFLTTKLTMSLHESQVDEPKWTVLVNHEEQYSLWREDRPVPAGWQQVYGPAEESACVDYVEGNWLDMRPKSIR